MRQRSQCRRGMSGRSLADGAWLRGGIMPHSMGKTGERMTPFNILAIVQAGRLQYEAVLLAASLRANSPDFAGTLYLAEPQPGPVLPVVQVQLELPMLRSIHRAETPW